MPRTSLSNGDTVELVDDANAHDTVLVVDVDPDASGTLLYSRRREDARRGVEIRADQPARLNTNKLGKPIFVHASGGGVDFSWHRQADVTIEYDPPTLRNADNVTFGTAEVAAPGTAVSLTSGGKVIPPGFDVTVRGNTSGGSVFVGHQDVTNRLGGNPGYRLNDTEIYRASVHDVGTLYIDADSAGDGVHWIVESQD